MKLRRKKAGDKDKMLENYIERRRELIQGRTMLLSVLQREMLKTEMIDSDFLAYKSESGQGGRTAKGQAWIKTIEDAEKKRKGYGDWKATVDQDLMEDEAAREALRNEKVIHAVLPNFDWPLPPVAMAPFHRPEEQILEREESESVSSSHDKPFVKPTLPQQAETP